MWTNPIIFKGFIIQKYSMIFLFIALKKKKAACKLYKHKASKFPNQASELESFSHKDTVLSTQNIIQKMFSGLDWAV